MNYEILTPPTLVNFETFHFLVDQLDFSSKKPHYETSCSRLDGLMNEKSNNNQNVKYQNVNFETISIQGNVTTR